MTDQQRATPGAYDTVAINQRYFREKHGKAFVEGSPHLKHKPLGDLCGRLATETLHRLPSQNEPPLVLDMGAGDGMLTLPLLALGARVVAVDASEELLRDLKNSAKRYNTLTAICGDVFAVLDDFQRTGRRFDIVCASSFLHHIPDYVGLCLSAAVLLRPGGVLFTFQDPLRYDSLGRFTYLFDRISYFTWRLFQGNYAQGLQTRLRRARGDYRDDLPEDTAEYHVVRNGVDQTALAASLQGVGLECSLNSYWSTQSTLFQYAGTRLRLKNTFGIVAQKKAVRCSVTSCSS